MKDIETTPDFASESIRKAVAEAEREKEEKAREREEKKRAAKEEAQKAKSSKIKSSKKWMEGINEDGKKYYYNLNTGGKFIHENSNAFLKINLINVIFVETVDDPPAAGYVSLAEQEWKREQREKKMNKNSVVIKNQEIYRPEKQPHKIVKSEYGPAPRSSHPYGAWQKVDPDPEPVDLQLPERPELVAVAVPSISDDSERKFKEKKIPTPGTIESSEGETSFKKRKFGGNPKRNMRQRLNDE